VGGPLASRWRNAALFAWLLSVSSIENEAVEDGCADLHFGDLTIEASCHEAFARQLGAMHFCFDHAALVIAALSFPERSAEPPD
jgi:hypothetical protein